MNTAQYIYNSIRIARHYAGGIYISVWCRAGREYHVAETLGLDGVE